MRVSSASLGHGLIGPKGEAVDVTVGSCTEMSDGTNGQWIDQGNNDQVSPCNIPESTNDEPYIAAVDTDVSLACYSSGRWQKCRIL